MVYIDVRTTPISTNERFLSVALDSSVIANGFKDLNLTYFLYFYISIMSYFVYCSNSKLLKLMGALSPAYLRVGGTMADCLKFSTDQVSYLHNFKYEMDGGECSYQQHYCHYSQKKNFTMNGN